MPHPSTRCASCSALLSEEGICARCALAGILAAPEPDHAGVSTTVRVFAGYELLEEIGRDGAMGSVYRARDPSSGRFVALKTVRVDRLKSAEILARFRIEMASAANLDHPHLLPILDTGEHEGQYYYTMKLASGGSLAQQMDRGMWSIPAGDGRNATQRQRAIAQLILGVAEGVQHAHEHGVLHRDLKPANILMDEDGTAYVSDFGLAKQLHSDSDLTRSQGMVGTPSYMAPEQAIAGGRHVTARTDVWALGAILYELLTGQPPFEGDGPLEVLEAARTVDPTPPSSLNPSVDRDLSTICLKCLEKDPQHRYASAREVASELRCVLGSEPIRARPPTRWESVTKWYRRNPVVALLLFGLWLSLGFGSLLTGWQWWVARESANRERAARLEADAIVLRQRIDRADYELDRGRASTRLANLAAVLRQQPTNRFAALAILHTLTFEPFPRPSIPAFRHAKRVVEIAVSPDDRLAATASYDLTARLWDTTTGLPVGAPMQHPTAVESVCFHPAGNALATGDQAGSVRIWSVPEGRLLHTLQGHTRVISGLAFTSNGRRLVSAGHDGTMRIWDPLEGRLLAGPIHTNAPAPRLGISADDNYALASGILDLRTPRMARERSRFDEADGDGFLRASERSDLVGAGSDFGLAWDRISRLYESTREAGFVRAGAHDIRFSPDDLWVAYAGRPGYRAATRNVLVPTNAGVSIEHEATVWHVAFSPAGDLLASVSSDGTARIRALDAEDESILLLRHGGDVSRSVFSREGTRFYTSSIDGTAQGWQLPTQLPPALPDEVAGRMIPKLNLDFWSRSHPGRGNDEPVSDGSNEQPVDEIDESLAAEEGPARSLKIRKEQGKPWRFAHTNHEFQMTGIQGLRSGTLASHSSRTVLHASGTNISVWRLDDDGKPRVARWAFPEGNSGIEIWGMTDRHLLVTSNLIHLQLRSVADPHLIISSLELDAQPVLSLPNEAADQVVIVLKPLTEGASGPGKLPLRVIALPGFKLLASQEISLVGVVESLELASDGRSMLLSAGDGYTSLLSLPDLRPMGAPFRSGSGLAMLTPGASVGPSASYLVKQGNRGLEWFDPSEGKPLGRPLRIRPVNLDYEHPTEASDTDWQHYFTPIIRVHPSGHFVAVTPVDLESDQGFARVLPSLPQLTRSPEWLPGLAEGIAREQIGPGGQPKACATEEYLKAVRSIMEDPIDDDLRRWGQWFVREGLDKPVHPWTKRTVRDEVTRLSRGSLQERKLALKTAPGDPQVHLRLAEGLEEGLPEASTHGRSPASDRQRADFLRERAVLLGDSDPVHLSRVLSTIESNAPALDPLIALRKITRKRPELLAFWRARLDRELSGGNVWELDECATNLVNRLPDWTTLDRMTKADRDGLASQIAFTGRLALAARLRRGPPHAIGAGNDFRYVDLTDHQNAERESAWHNLKDEGNNLHSLNRGLLEAAQIPFVISEVTQVLGSSLAAFHPDYPEQIQGIRVRRSVRRLHFLEGAGWGEKEGTLVGRYRVRYVGGGSVEIPIRYGSDLRNWQYWPESVEKELHGAVPAWKGPQERWKGLFPDWGVRLYVQTWNNPDPERPVESVDFESSLTGCAPFLVGLTAEVAPDLGDNP